MSFTPQQAALIAETGHALALAGPGSGKTSTIIEKIARLLQQPGNRVVACSFTREGAEEIRRRLTKRMGTDAISRADVRIGTFHSMIAEHRKNYGRSPKMLSPAHQMRTLSTAASEHGAKLTDVLQEFEEIKHSLIPPDPSTLPRWFLTYEEHLRTLKAIDLQDLIRTSVHQMALSVDLPEFDSSADPEKCSMPVKLAMAAAQYKRALNAKCDHLRQMASEAENSGQTALAARHRAALQLVISEEGALPLLGATHLLIDESQDNDELQFALATLHALAKVTTTLIGDDDQTIYEWRRAMGYPGLMSFAATFDAKVITLGENFRSLRTIVERADSLIRHNDGHRIEKQFLARRGPGGDVQALKTGTAAGMIVHAKELICKLAHEGEDPSGKFKLFVQSGNFAVLGRNNFVLDDMELVLLKAGVKYNRQGSSILHREAAQYVYDLLGAVYAGDIKGVSFLLQIKGVGSSLANRVCAAISGKERAFISGKMTNFAQFGDGAEVVRECSDWFAARQSEILDNKTPEAIGEVCALVRELFEPSSPSDWKNVRNQRCITVVQHCLTRMRGHVMRRVAALQDKSAEGLSANSVSIMTFHGSKGLEFKNVVILGADESSCPGKGELMSERRLFYVAVTRAKDFVLALYSAAPSRYLTEMGLPLIEKSR